MPQLTIAESAIAAMSFHLDPLAERTKWPSCRILAQAKPHRDNESLALSQRSGVDQAEESLADVA
jgi:hypothetical protein